MAFFIIFKGLSLKKTKATFLEGDRLAQIQRKTHCRLEIPQTSCKRKETFGKDILLKWWQKNHAASEATFDKNLKEG